MIVYLDLLIIATIVVNYAFIKTIALLYKEKLNILRVIFALIVSVLMLLLFLLPYKVFFGIRYFMGILIGFLAFNDKSIKQLVIKIVIFYILNLCFIGTLFVFSVKSVFMMFITMIYIIFLYFIQNYKNKIDIITNIKIGDLHFEAFYDTGNVTSYKDMPIVFINEKYKSNSFTLIDTISIKTIEGISLINIYIGPKLFIKNIEREVYYSFSKHIQYDVVLNKNIGGIRC